MKCVRKNYTQTKQQHKQKETNRQRSDWSRDARNPVN